MKSMSKRITDCSKSLQELHELNVLSEKNQKLLSEAVYLLNKSQTTITDVMRPASSLNESDRSSREITDKLVKLLNMYLSNTLRPVANGSLVAKVTNGGSRSLKSVTDSNLHRMISGLYSSDNNGSDLLVVGGKFVFLISNVSSSLYPILIVYSILGEHPINRTCIRLTKLSDILATIPTLADCLKTFLDEGTILDFRHK